MNTSFIQKGLLIGRKLSPTALTVVGVAGVVTAAVLACRSTLKVAQVTEDAKLEIDLARETGEAKELTKAYGRACYSYAKLYGPSVILGVSSIVAISGGHAILLKRNAALASALTMTEKAFKSYRKAVIDEIGEEREREIHYNQVVEREDDTKAGVVRDKITMDTSRSPYARFFDELNPNWVENHDYNRVFLEAQQAQANMKLQAQKYLLLNDVYEALGFSKTTAGALVGWALGNGGDEFVDFGIYDLPRTRDFVNGDQPGVLLDFNVDGVVYDLISKLEPMR